MSRKICLIVGVGPGNGFALTERFAREGFEVVMIARKMDALNTYKKTLAQKGHTTHSYAADVADRRNFTETLRQIVADFGRIDVVIYNVSLLTMGQPSEVDIDNIERDMNVNVLGGIAAIQHLLPTLKQQDDAAIFITGGGAALAPMGGVISLSMTKAAIRYYALALADELKDSHIYVGTVTICGMVERGTHFDPDRIADEFWRLYTERPENPEFKYE